MIATGHKRRGPKPQYRRMTPLAKWLWDSDQTASALAAEIGVSISTVTRIANGETSPTILIAARIVKAAGGALKYEDLV